jgi:hypothetical protein
MEGGYQARAFPSKTHIRYNSVSVPIQSDNTSGQGKNTVVPLEIRKWNWGALLITPVWGIANKVYISLLVFLPVFNLLLPIYLGIKGSELAWRHKQWESVEHFRMVQLKWDIAGLIVTILFVLILLLFPEVRDYLFSSELKESGTDVVGNALN